VGRRNAVPPRNRDGRVTNKNSNCAAQASRLRVHEASRFLLILIRAHNHQNKRQPDQEQLLPAIRASPGNDVKKMHLHVFYVVREATMQA
jgi:hypothetical protein